MPLQQDLHAHALTTSTERNNSVREEKRRIQATTFFVALCTMASRLMGFVRVGVMSAFFGASALADVLNLVLSIPNNFRKLFAEGALSHAFMPVFAKTVSKDTDGIICKTEESQQFFASLLFWVGLPISMLTALMSFFSQAIVKLFFRFSSPQDERLAALLFSIVVFFLLFMVLSAIAAGVQQTHKRFLIPALAPLLLSLCVISSIVFFASRFSIYSAACGYVLGGFAQSLLLFLTLRPLGYKIQISTRLTKSIKQTFSQLVPIGLSLLIPIVGQQLAFYFASTLTEGSSSFFAYAIIFWQLPIGVVFNSIISIGFSYTITALQSGSGANPLGYEQNSVRTLLICAVPLTILMFFLAHAGVAVALQRGQFTALQAYATARVLKGYALSLVPFAMYQMLVKLLYARQKARMVLLFSATLTLVDVVATALLIRTPLQVAGISVAYTLACVLVAPLLYAYFFRLNSHKLILIRDVLKIILGNIPLLVAAYIASELTKHHWHSGSTLITLGLFACVALALLLVCIIGYKGVGISVLSMMRSYRRR